MYFHKRFLSGYSVVQRTFVLLLLLFLKLFWNKLLILKKYTFMFTTTSSKLNKNRRIILFDNIMNLLFICSWREDLNAYPDTW